MSSKLDYLSKYLGPAPGEAQKKKDKKRAKAMSSTLRIRDETELLPDAKKDKVRRRLEENEVTIVDEEDTQLSQKPKHDTSGVQWNSAPVFQKRNAPSRRTFKISQGSDDDDRSPSARGQAVEKRTLQVRATSSTQESVAAPGIVVPPPKKSKPSIAVPNLSPARERANRDVGDDDLSPPRRKAQVPSKMDVDADLSPPRKKNKQDSDGDMSPPRGKPKQDADGDLSPPRGNPRHDSDGDMSPPRGKPQQDAEGDLSPPRAKPKKDTDGDLSPPRGKPRHDSDGDLSPPRGKSKRDADGDLSPPREKPKRDADGDLSPPRGKPMQDADGDLSPPRGKPKRDADADGDLSPPRKPKHDADGDLSPPRGKPKQDADGDLSPPRGKTRRDADGDLSPPRGKRRRDADGDLSPPRGKPKRDADGDLSPPRGKPRRDPDGDLSPPRQTNRGQKMSSGLSAGLQSTEALKEESARIRERTQDSALAKESKHAETVFRDKAGKRVTKEEWTKIQEAKKKRRRQVPDQVLEWGKGLVQKQSLVDEQEEAAKVALEPFARFEVTAEHDAELAEKDRWNDPMAKYMEKTETKDTVLKDQQEKKARPKCRFPGPPNRYGIQPGYRWDGKIRGNGFEQRYFQAKNNRQHEKQVVSKLDVDDW